MEGEPRAAALPRFLSRVVEAHAGEWRALGWSSAYFFCLLSSYYVIRPLRETMGVAGGVRNLPWLFTGTLVVMLLVNPPFAALVAKLPRRGFVSLTYRFFQANLLVFLVLLVTLPAGQGVWAGRAFFIWTSVFNLFVVSIFWGVMADVFRPDQGKRLFGFIGAGGTLGALVGSGATALLAERLPPPLLLVLSMILLEVAVLCVARLSALSPMARDGSHREVRAEEPIGGRVLAGLTHVAQSPYLLGICGFMLLFTFGSTTLYFQQAEIAGRAFTDAGARTAFFAKLDFTVNLITLLTQGLVTGRILKALGVAGTLTLLPALSLVGFLGLGLWPTLAVFVTFQVLRRAGDYAVTRPTREILYTVLRREDKFKAKSFIDTFVYRGGDQIAAWSNAGLRALGLGLAGIALVSAPLAGLWLMLGLWLGRRQAELEGTRPEPALIGERSLGRSAL